MQPGPRYSICPGYRRVAIVTLCKTRYTQAHAFWDNGPMNTLISLPELEQAINYWRDREPSQGEESRLCAPAAALATPYAMMIMAHQREIPAQSMSPAALAAYQGWLDQQKASS